MEKVIDITMTATRRPELVRDTLTSFRENLFGDRLKNMRLIVNVDPVGRDISSGDVVDVCKEFSDDVLFRIAERPSFPMAFQWCWRQSHGEYIFNLEEDWRLLVPVDLDKMLALMEGINQLVNLRLSFSPCLENVKNWNIFIPWNGEFYEVPEHVRGLLGFCGHPSLIKQQFVDVALSILDGRSNPEKQLKWRVGRETFAGLLQSWRYGVYGFPGMGAAVLDIGRKWKAEHGWAKVDRLGNSKNKSFFTHWEKVDGQRVA